MPSSLSIPAATMERVCRKLISSDFDLSDYHYLFDNVNGDEYRKNDDLYIFLTGSDYFYGDNYNAEVNEVTMLSDGKISVKAVVYYAPTGEASNFHTLEYTFEPISDNGIIYLKLLQIKDNGSAEDQTKTARIEFKAYQNLDDLKYSDTDDNTPYDERPVIAEAKLTVPATWIESSEEILVNVDREDYTGLVRCMSFNLIKVTPDYTLTHDIHEKRSSELRKYQNSEDVGFAWNFLDGYSHGSCSSASGYDYISYYYDSTDENDKKSRSEQRYYRISDEYVAGVYFGADEDYYDEVVAALDNMTFEVK